MTACTLKMACSSVYRFWGYALHTVKPFLRWLQMCTDSLVDWSLPSSPLPLLHQADNLVSKVSAAQQSVLDSLAHIEKMQVETRNTDSGRRLEVNENILGLTFKLEKGMQNLIAAANAMRAGLEQTKGEVEVN